MSLNESTLIRRQRWPLEFDLEGVPMSQRAALLQSREAGLKVQNTFAVDYQNAEVVTDINNPQVPRVPYQEFPKMLYAADYVLGDPKGYVVVESQKEEQNYLKRGYTTKPNVKKSDAA